jgi:hypothetical protein
MVQEDLVSVSSKRWPCVVAENGGSVGQTAYPNNLHTTELCPVKTQELVCIYTARSSRPPAGCSWWVWIGPLTLRGALELDAEGSENPSSTHSLGRGVRRRAHKVISHLPPQSYSLMQESTAVPVVVYLVVWNNGGIRLHSPDRILSRSPQQYEPKRIKVKSN